jgi:hypothetical protein
MFGSAQFAIQIGSQCNTHELLCDLQYTYIYIEVCNPVSGHLSLSPKMP